MTEVVWRSADIGIALENRLLYLTLVGLYEAEQLRGVGRVLKRRTIEVYFH